MTSTITSTGLSQAIRGCIGRNRHARENLSDQMHAIRAGFVENATKKSLRKEETRTPVRVLFAADVAEELLREPMGWSRTSACVR